MNWLRKLFRFSKTKKEEKPGLGTFLGVFVPCILMVFGVIIYLRLGWIVGEAGLSTALLIITFASLIALITTLSMATIATNIEIGNGGVYYMLSRSLGLEVGCALGLPLYFKQTLSIAFCVVGFAESLHDLIPSVSIVTIGICSLAVLTIFAYTSLRGALKLQVVIFVAIIASLISLFTGGELNAESANIPTQPHVTSMGFWAIFAIFFPAMTGVESSVSLSGDLRNPSRSLPLGTISAILVAYGIYMAIPIFLAKNVSMERLSSDPFIMCNIARFPSLIILGIWGATLSSALGGLLGAPRTLQALAEDAVVPKFFGRTYGPDRDPKIATLVTFVLAFGGVYFGSINVIAPLLTMICLICYGVLNFSAGLETLMANPSWRPRFQIPWVIPAFGGILCLLTMVMIDAGVAIIALCLVFLIYLVAKSRQVSGSWEDIRQGILMFFSRFAIYRLAYAETASKSWRPHFLVFTGKPDEPSNHLVRFSQAISQSKGFLTMASFLFNSEVSEIEKRNLSRTIAQKWQTHRIQALVQICRADTVTSGMKQMIEYYGLGPLVPNTIVFGEISQKDETIEFARVVQTANQRHYNVVIINERNASLPISNKGMGDIHLWWDDLSKTNSELMLVLGFMLQRNPLWKKARICVKSIAASEILKQEKIAELKNLEARHRVPLDIKVYVTPNPAEEFLSLVNAFSKDAEVVFLSLRQPEENESMDLYKDYLQSMSAAACDLPLTALVLGSEHTPLKNILK